MMTTESIAPETSVTGRKEATLVDDLNAALGDARNSLHDARIAVAEKARVAAETSEAYVKANPWKVLGVAAAAGLLIAGFFSRRR